MLNALYEAYLITLSSPIKPGALHRLTKDPEYEIRLLEFVSVQEFIEESYKRGYMLGRGDLDSKHLGLGRYIADALKKAFERTSIRPITGLISASITLASILGYYTASSQKKSFEETLRKTVTTILYSSSPEDTINIVEGLEAVSDSDLLLHLDRKGITKRSITLNAVTVGDLFEALSDIDTGFMLNVRNLNRLTTLIASARKSPTFIGAVVEVYIKLADMTGYLDLSDILETKNPLGELAKLDAKLVDRQRFNRLLGGTFIAVATANIDTPLRIPYR
ncbi:MAG: hypothetical protein GSR81_02490 [Desulfurococcales archaeon]|nr:hypothetical protein [Desulfurococcales archaeon]